MKYHTALKKEGYEPENIVPETHFVFDGCTAFQWDIVKNGLSLSYDVCDVFYVDIPWRHGYQKFISKAGQGGSSYEDFIKSLNKVISLGVPIVIVAGKSLAKFVPNPEVLFKVMMVQGSPALAYVFNFKMPEIKKTQDIVEYLADRFECLGDFCCGYGFSGDIFYKKGKWFVMSDINPYCVGYIKSRYDNKN